MNLIKDSFEDFELIMPNGEVYGKIQGYELKSSSLLDTDDNFYTCCKCINNFDIIRRCRDGKCFRIWGREYDENFPFDIWGLMDYTLFTTETE